MGKTAKSASFIQTISVKHGKLHVWELHSADFHVKEESFFSYDGLTGLVRLHLKKEENLKYLQYYFLAESALPGL